MIKPEIITGRLGNKMFEIAYLYAQVRKGLIPDWYVQDIKHFKDYEQGIKMLFGTGIGYLSQVGIHVRRGANPLNPSEPKYSFNPFYTNLSETDYYERAMAMFPNEKFVVFSDDPEWCKEKFKGDNIQVMDIGDDVDDFNLFASCKDQILANSSFSYWAGYLNPNITKKVIAPIETKYYSDGVVRTKYPKEFIQIDFKYV